MKFQIILGLIILFSALTGPQRAWGLPGTEGAGFLNIPTGGRPAALGGAYSALAADAYAPVSNPGGLGFLKTPQVALMHLSYLESISTDFASLVYPFTGGHSVGASVQNLRAGRTPSTDINGISSGEFSGSFLAATLGYGKSIGANFSVGLVGKVIRSRIAGFSATGYAGDVGAMIRPLKNLGFSAVAANIGSKMTFIENGDPLPSSLRVGGFYSPFHRWIFALQGTRAKSGLTSGQSGIEWSPIDFLFIRAGYRTETARENSSSAGMTAGIGIQLAGQKFDYAYAPMGDLGNAQYFSMVFQWGRGPQENLSPEKDPPIVFKEKKKDDKDDGEIRFQQERIYPEIGRGGLHP